LIVKVQDGLVDKGDTIRTEHMNIVSDFMANFLLDRIFLICLISICRQCTRMKHPQNGPIFRQFKLTTDLQPLGPLSANFTKMLIF